jgi:SAM-dependent methyltransferase
MAGFYAEGTYARAEDNEPNEVGKRLDAYNAGLAERASRGLPGGTARGARVLDIGCGDGRFLAAMAARGAACVEGLETDPVAARLARRRTGATIHERGIEQADLPEAGFDLVSLLHVLEHVPDPRATLIAARRVLRPGGGVLFVALPNAGSLEAALFGSAWYHLDLPRHLWGFTPHTLVRLVEECGFAVSGLRSFPFLFAPQSLRNVIRAVRKRRPEMRAGSGANRNGPSSGRWQTQLFLGLLALSERAGRTWPGEILELTATRTDET